MKPNTTPIPKFDVVRACDLLAEELAPIRMIVEPYIPAGLFLVAGDPKAGKTLLMQDLALSITRGESAWGGLHVDQGSALYLANEGGKRSFRDRIVKMLEIDTDDEALSATSRGSPARSTSPSRPSRWGNVWKSNLSGGLSRRRILA
jgi:hypothetical protein